VWAAVQNGQCFLRPCKEAGLYRILAAFKLRTIISRVIKGRALPAEDPRLRD
jgi:hypothetical protein